MSTRSQERPAGAPPAGSLCSRYGGLDLAVMAVTGTRKITGNGVVPQQAAAALRLLTGAAAVAAPAAGGTRAAA